MINLRENYWAVELTNLGDHHKSFQILGPDKKWAVPYLKYSYRSIYHTNNRGKDFYCGEEDPLDNGTWEIICTNTEVKASHAPKLFGYAMIGDEYAKETIASILASKGCDLNKTYLILKKEG